MEAMYWELNTTEQRLEGQKKHWIVTIRRDLHVNKISITWNEASERCACYVLLVCHAWLPLSAVSPSYCLLIRDLRFTELTTLGSRDCDDVRDSQRWHSRLLLL